MAWLRLIRPFNGLLAVLSLWVATYLASGEFFLQLRTSLALFLLISYGYVVNDIFDRKLDAVGKPYRPLPAGEVTTRSAVELAIILVLGSMAFAAWAEPVVIMYVGIVALLLFHYAFSLSGMPFVGNFLVALLGSSVFYLGGMISTTDDYGWQLLFVATILSFLHHLSRELVKDVEDEEADRRGGRRTLAVILSRRAMRVIAGVTLLLLVSSTYLLYVRFDLGFWYLVVVSMGVNLPLIVTYLTCVRPGEARRLRWASLIFKLTMLPGLVALILARGEL